MIERAIPFLYLAAAVSFVLALKWLSSVSTARRGVIVGIAGMALAVGGTLLRPEIVSYRWIVAAIVAGTVIGIPMALMPMTAVPQRTRSPTPSERSPPRWWGRRSSTFGLPGSTVSPWGPWPSRCCWDSSPSPPP